MECCISNIRQHNPLRHRRPLIAPRALSMVAISLSKRRTEQRSVAVQLALRHRRPLPLTAPRALSMVAISLSKRRTEQRSVAVQLALWHRHPLPLTAPRVLSMVAISLSKQHTEQRPVAVLCVASTASDKHTPKTLTPSLLPLHNPA